MLKRAYSEFEDVPPPPLSVNAPCYLNVSSRARLLFLQPFATDAVKTAGQAKSPAGVFGVTVEALSGAFLKTRVVTVWPRFVVRNNLGRSVGVLSTVEPPPKRGKDHGQSIARVTEVGPRGSWGKHAPRLFVLCTTGHGGGVLVSWTGTVFKKRVNEQRPTTFFV